MNNKSGGLVIITDETPDGPKEHTETMTMGPVLQNLLLLSNLFYFTILFVKPTKKH
jgi:hypothetical protein